MDQHKLRTLVFEKTGVRIDVDDPVFALVALNEAVLAEAVERHVALMDDATADLAEQLQALQDSGSLCHFQGGAGEPAPAAVSVRTAEPKTGAAPLASMADKRLLAVAGGAAVLCARRVLSGQAMFFKVPPPPPSTMIAKELSPDQAMAIRNGEKLSRIVQKLDAKTRSTIAAEMQKP